MLYIVCIAILFAITAWVGLRNTKVESRDTLSKHVGKNAQSIAVARICFPLIGILLLLWFFTQYLVTHTLPFDAVIGMILFAITIVIQGLFPYGQSKRWDHIHDISAWSAAIIGPILLLRFAWVTPGSIQLALFACGWMSVGMLATLFIIVPARKYSLFLQLAMVLVSGVCFSLLTMQS